MLQPKTTIIIGDIRFFAEVYGITFLSNTVEGVRDQIDAFEEHEWPQNRRLQSYRIKEV